MRNLGLEDFLEILEQIRTKNKQISFQYLEWNEKKQLIPRKNGAEYIVSPWMLISNEENYYLVAYDEAASIIKHYRVDKMSGIKVLKENRTGENQYKKWKPTEYTSQTFGMFGGRTEDVSLIFPSHLIGVVIDRF